MESDAVVQRIVGSWPGRWDMTQAHALGFKGGSGFESVVRTYIADDLEASVGSIDGLPVWRARR